MTMSRGPPVAQHRRVAHSFDARERKPRDEPPSALSVSTTNDGAVVVVSVPLADAARSLTDAEQRVAELAARGMSNAQIATERGTSVRTVANQIASCLRKLDVGSRAALARVIGARGQ
jgi:DNA-binding NarL/FixJ family response regulator